jgi:hypothetical protein
MAILRTFRIPHGRQRRRGSVLMFLALPLLLMHAALAGGGGTILYVDDDAPPGGDGLSWETAFRYLQDALAAAREPGSDVDEIRVGEGVHYPDEGSGQTPGDRTASFILIDGIPVVGGFAGLGASDPDEHDPEVYETMLSGDLGGDDYPPFHNYDENSLHVTMTPGEGEGFTLIGVAVSGGNADGGNPQAGNDRGGGLYSTGVSIDLIRCRFSRNRSGEPGSWGWGGAIFADGALINATECEFRQNYAHARGGAIRLQGGATITGDRCTFSQNSGYSGGAIDAFTAGVVSLNACVFQQNEARAAGGGAVSVEQLDEVVVTECDFESNHAEGAGGGLEASPAPSIHVESSRFIDNESVAGGGAVVQAVSCTVENCVFLDNRALYFAGGLFYQSADGYVVNCLVARNLSLHGGGIFTGAENSHFVNCTIAFNVGNGIVHDLVGDGTVVSNSIVWGNSPHQIAPFDPSRAAELTVRYSDVQGGWDGLGEDNIDADPLFVSPGADNFRLSFGSPCIDAGDNDAIPPEIELDLDDEPRIQGDIVDMGAYEGEDEFEPPQASNPDLDQGESDMLIPGGWQFNPLQHSAVLFANISGGDDASVTVTEYIEDLHPEAGGFSELAATLTLETSLSDGEFKATFFIPFSIGDLDGADPMTIDLTYFDADVGNRGLAVSRNTANSPGWPWPIGDRILAVAPEGWGLTGELGDWGVFWDPATQRGFAWANVDFAGDFAIGLPLCAEDCHQPPNGVADFEDLVDLIDRWSTGYGPFDINNDGEVTVLDLLALLGSWGVCP